MVSPGRGGEIGIISGWNFQESESIAKEKRVVLNEFRSWFFNWKKGVGMKKLAFVFLMLLIVSPVWALFCQSCGKEMPGDAKFCPQCGKEKAAGASEKSVPQEAAKGFELEESALCLYEPVEKLEALLSSTNYAKILPMANDYRHQMTVNFQKLSARGADVHPNMKRLHTLYLKKFDLLEQYLDAWNKSGSNPARGHEEARKDKILFSLAKTNEMISVMIDGKGDSSLLAKVDQMEKDLVKATKEFVVTSPYLQIDNRRVQKNSLVWVMEEKNGMVKLMNMSETKLAVPVTGWVSVYDVERRTNWRSDNPPVRPTYTYEPPTQVIVVERDRWGWGHCGHHHRRKDHPWIVIRPRYWGN